MLKSIPFAIATTMLIVSGLLNGSQLAAQEKQSPFVVQGRVTDDQGRPLAGVEVNANCGMGSLFHTGTAKSDQDGKYRLVFGPGGSIGGTKLGVGTQVATISPRKTGWYEIHLGRRGNLLMSEWKDKLQPDDTKGYSGVVQVNAPYELNFTMAKAGTVHGRLVNEFGSPIQGVEMQLTGDILPPSCGILASAQTDEQGKFTFDSVPVWLADSSIKLKWRFTLRPFGVRHELATSSFEVSADEDAVQELTLDSQGNDREVRLTLNRRSVSGAK
jgi:hypothetical protein